MILARRKLLLGLGAVLAAPAIVRTAGLLMPVRSVRPAVSFDPTSASAWSWTMWGFDRFGREVCETVRVSDGRVLRAKTGQKRFRGIIGIRVVPA